MASSATDGSAVRSNAKTESAAVRERLTHPVVDADGHTVEFLPAICEYVRDIGGENILKKVRDTMLGARNTIDGGPDRTCGSLGWHGLSRQQRHDMRVTRQPFWSYPTARALDRATVMLPNLYRERLDDLGIDFAIVYGSRNWFLRNPDEDIRRIGCRAVNSLNAELFGPHSDRLAPVALIPMNTPDEAVAELEFAVKKLGYKAVSIGGCIRRKIAEVERKAPEVASYATWMDVLAHASEYDYDPVWKKCVELRVAPTAHSPSRGWGARTSPFNSIYNHIGHFAAAGEAFCKALVIGGVVQRFPTLKFAFLEGGVGWASALYNDLIEHWEKRNLKALRANLDPAKLDGDTIQKLFAQYGGRLAQMKQEPEYIHPMDPADLDEWSALTIKSARDFKGFFENFFFGCEADDRLTAFAFNTKTNHFETRLHAMFGSDVGHWDVTDLTTVVAEAYELVEHELLTDSDFRDFSFANAVKLHGGMNPEFFTGTVVEHEAEKDIGRGMTAKSRSALVRERLNHPVIDVDGHFVEIVPVLDEYFREVGGTKLFEKYKKSTASGRGVDRGGGSEGWYGLSPQQRRDKRVARSAFWAYPTASALDRATVMLPNLFRERLDELGIDFSILYGSVSNIFLKHPDEEIRRAGCRAFNKMSSDLYGPHADRMTAVADIPMHTPEEAIDELEHAVNVLGMKAVVLATCIRRPVVDVVRRAPEVAAYATWMDVIGLSSDFDYDPVWKKCVELKVAVTAHTSLVGWGARALPDNFVYNHIGHFGQAGEAFCKALVIGGVVQRFPELKFGFLEGGAGWACSLYNDLIEHWGKRNIKAMRENLDPANLDRAQLNELFMKYGGSMAERQIDPFANNPAPENPADLDEWSALDIDDPRAFADFFGNFFFGCEPDDRMAAVAFNPKMNHYGAKIQAMFSSDVGHFDVTDITSVVAEAYELVEDELLTESDFRDYSFGNAAKLHAGMNSDFFKGTIVEAAVAQSMGGLAQAK